MVDSNTKGCGATRRSGWGGQNQDVNLHSNQPGWLSFRALEWLINWPLQTGHFGLTFIAGSNFEKSCIIAAGYCGFEVALRELFIHNKNE